MRNMDKEKAADFVVKQLGKHHNRNEITLALCERMDLGWNEASRLVQEIESQNSRAIAARQSPIIIIFGVAIFIAGLGLTCYNSLYFVNYFQSQHNGVSLNAALELNTAYYRVGYLLTGLALMVSGIVGCWKTLSTFLKK